jgi:hypothetical protein
MITLILGILTFFVVLYFDVNSDYKRIPKGEVSHGRGQVIRTLALLPSFIFFVLPIDDKLLVRMLITAFMIGAWWWELFDGFLNLKRGYSWRFNGSDDEDDAKTDNFLQHFTPLQQMIIKWTLIILSTSLYVIF